MVRGAAPHETLPCEHPPLEYYRAPCEGLEKEPALRSGREKQAALAGGDAAVQPALAAA